MNIQIFSKRVLFCLIPISIIFFTNLMEAMLTTGWSLTFDTHCYYMGTAMKHPVPDWVKLSFVIFDIRALWRSALSIIVHVKNYKWRLNTVWHMMLCVCTHTVGIKGLICSVSGASACLLFSKRFVVVWFLKFMISLCMSLASSCASDV